MPELLHRFADEVVLFFDADTAGQRAAERALEVLFDAGLQVKIGEMPAGEDPDSLIRKSGSDSFRARVESAEDFFDFQINHKLSDDGIENHCWQSGVRPENVSIYQCGARSRCSRHFDQPIGHPAENSAGNNATNGPFLGQENSRKRAERGIVVGPQASMPSHTTWPLFANRSRSSRFFTGDSATALAIHFATCRGYRTHLENFCLDAGPGRTGQSRGVFRFVTGIGSRTLISPSGQQSIERTNGPAVLEAVGLR